MDSSLYYLIVDSDALATCREAVPESVQMVTASPQGSESDMAPAPGRICLAAVVDPRNNLAFRARLKAQGQADVPVIECDAARPIRLARDLLELISQRMAGAEREVGETRSISALLRRENLTSKTRFREIESFLYSLGNPQFSRSLCWEPSGRVCHLPPQSTVVQQLPVNAVSISAIDLWLPELPRNRNHGLSLSILDAGGATHDLVETYDEAGLSTGWVRFMLRDILAGDARGCSLLVRHGGATNLVVGMGMRAPDRRFAAKGDEIAGDEVLALRIWKALAGASLPESPSAMLRAAEGSIQSSFRTPGSLPAPELFAMPASATDYVTSDYWENEDAVIVHPSRSGPACAVIRDVPMPRLRHLTAIVTVGHARAPSLNLAIGVAPHGAVGRDGFWQGRMGAWVHGLPAHGWAQAHCIPSEPIIDRADIFLAASLAQDVPNDLSWALFRGFRFVTDVASTSLPEGEV